VTASRVSSVNVAKEHKYLETAKVNTSVEIIMMCCVLHNICTLTNDNIEDFLAQDGDDDGVVNNGHIVQIHDEEEEVLGMLHLLKCDLPYCTSASHLSTSLIVSKFWNRERFQGIQCKCGKRAYYFYISCCN
jgi:hypothetical protein